MIVLNSKDKGLEAIGGPSGKAKPPEGAAVADSTTSQELYMKLRAC